MRQPSAGGGWHAIGYTLKIARRVGFLQLWKAMRSRNACKTCALGMGGQRGGMRNELGRFPEVCKKSLQAMAADMQGAISDAFFATYSLRQLQAMSPRELETAGRLTLPLYAAPGATHYRQIGWDEAVARAADRLKAVDPSQAFFYLSGRSSNEAGFLLQLFARAYGTNHVNNCSYYCHQASGVGLTASVGTGTATLDVGSIEHADLLFLIGGNPASNHPRLMTHLMHLRRRGGRVVVINPVEETGLKRFRVPSDPWSLLFGSRIASDYVQVNIGGDIPLLMGIAKAVVARGAVDTAYVAAATTGWDETCALLERTSWVELEQRAGVPRAVMEQLGQAYAGADRAIFAWTMGITHHLHGVQNVQWIVNLALMRGMIGKPHAGLLPIRGHSNVQGMGSVGVTPALKDAVLRRFADYGIKIPEHKGFDTMECMEAAHAGALHVGWALGGNLYGANPDAAYAATSLGRLDMMVYMSTALNTGHAHGLGRETLILPVLARDEEPYRTTQESMFNYVRVSDGGTARHAGPRGEVPLLAAMAQRVLGDSTGPVTWASLADTDALRRLIARLVPDFGAIAEAGRTAKEFVVPGRLLAHGTFPTPSGRAAFHAHPVPAPTPLAAGQLLLMTVRSEGQFNTVVYEDDDLYRGQASRDVILMHPTDITRLGLAVDQPVTVGNATGLRQGIRVRPFNIKPGHALMYYPEANCLIPRAVDPRSRTPAFKAVAVEIQAEAPGTARARPLPGRPVAPRRALSGMLRLARRILRPKLNAC